MLVRDLSDVINAYYLGFCRTLLPYIPINPFLYNLLFGSVARIYTFHGANLDCRKGPIVLPRNPITRWAFTLTSQVSQIDAFSLPVTATKYCS
jgi:hypothetical protein